MTYGFIYPPFHPRLSFISRDHKSRRLLKALKEETRLVFLTRRFTYRHVSLTSSLTPFHFLEIVTLETLLEPYFFAVSPPGKSRKSNQQQRGFVLLVVVVECERDGTERGWRGLLVLEVEKKAVGRFTSSRQS